MDKPQEDGYIEILLVGVPAPLTFLYKDIPTSYSIDIREYGIQVNYNQPVNKNPAPYSRCIYPWHTIFVYREYSNTDTYQLALVEYQDTCSHVWKPDFHGLFGDTCYRECEKCGRTVPLHDGREHSADDNV